MSEPVDHIILRTYRNFLRQGLFGRASIRKSLLLVLFLALAPLAILAAWVGTNRIASNKALTRNTVILTTARVGGLERAVIEKTMAVLTVVASAPVESQCGRALSVAAQSIPEASGFASVAADGHILCSIGEIALRGTNSASIGIWQEGSRKHSGISASMPWAVGSGRVIAQISLQRLSTGLVERHATREQAVAITDANGRVIASSKPLPWSKLNAKAGDNVLLSRADAQDGHWLYSTLPIARDSDGRPVLYVVVVQKRPGLLGRDGWFLVTYVGLPILAILLASLTLWFALNRTLIGWIEVLRQDANFIGAGNYTFKTGRFRDAPHEIRGLAASIQLMAHTVAQRDATLTRNLAIQRNVVMEMHHRVRNNLQIISSFLSLRKHDGDAEEELDGAQLRVAGLAMVHRLLYDLGEQASVSAAALLRELGLLFEQQQRPVQLAMAGDVPDLSIDIDAAIIITLWSIEVLSWISAAGSVGQADISLRIEDDETSWSIGWPMPPPAGTIGAKRMVRALATQLGGRIVTDEVGRNHLTLVCSPQVLNKRFVAATRNNLSA